MRTLWLLFLLLRRMERGRSPERAATFTVLHSGKWEVMLALDASQPAQSYSASTLAAALSRALEG